MQNFLKSDNPVSYLGDTTNKVGFQGDSTLVKQKSSRCRFTQTKNTSAEQNRKTSDTDKTKWVDSNVVQMLQQDKTRKSDDAHAPNVVGSWGDTSQCLMSENCGS